MGRVIFLCGWLCLLTICLPRFAYAATPGGKLIFSLNPGIAFFAMQDLNNRISREQSGFMDVTPSENLGTLSMGLDLGNSLQYGIHDHLIVGLEFAYLSTNTSAKMGDGPLYPPQDIYYEINVPAVELSLLAKAAFSLSPSILVTLGGGLSALALADAGESLESRGTLTGRVYSASNLRYKGSATGFKLIAGIDFFIWDWLSLGLEGGYRRALFEEIRADMAGEETILTKPDHSNFTLDYSGAFIHYAFRFYF